MLTKNTNSAKTFKKVAGENKWHYSCYIVTLIPGIWGPYYSAVLEGYWLHEGGQSAVGSLIDHLIHSHPAFKCIQSKSKNVYQYLEQKCIEQAEKESLPSIHWLTKKLHICPDFHGNRSPYADSDLKGSILGLELDKSELSLAKLYLAAIQALAYGTKSIGNVQLIFMTILYTRPEHLSP